MELIGCIGCGKQPTKRESGNRVGYACANDDCLDVIYGTIDNPLMDNELFGTQEEAVEHWNRMNELI